MIREAKGGLSQAVPVQNRPQRQKTLALVGVLACPSQLPKLDGRKSVRNPAAAGMARILPTSMNQQ
jgi:hypothetical protein